MVYWLSGQGSGDGWGHGFLAHVSFGGGELASGFNVVSPTIAAGNRISFDAMTARVAPSGFWDMLAGHPFTNATKVF
jgi:hypothetical protein